MRLIIIILSFFLLYQTSSHSKVTEKNEFNQKYLSNYFSAIISYDNQNNEDALKFFNASKFLIQRHDNFLRKYVFSLVLDGQIKRAIDQIKITKNANSSNFFESNLLLYLDSFAKKNYRQATKRLKKLENFIDNGTYEFVIYKILESYNVLFLNKKIEKPNKNFGKISLITNAFQNCYLNSKKTNSYFLNLINSSEGDYSRYLFFYLANIIENKEYNVAKEISTTIEPLTSSLLISQSKNWIKDKNFKKFTIYFSCKNENHLLSEFFYLISNLFSSQEKFEKSNFYLSLSNYLNPKFYFNLSLLAENYYLNNNFDLTKKTLKKFNSTDEIYYWHKIKRIANILSKQKNEEVSLKFIEKKFTSIKNPSIKILYDLANIYKNFKKYEKAVDYYSKVLSKVDNGSPTYADILYKRGGSYERLGQHYKSDVDLLQSLEITPDDPYTMNYLAYSWLERNYKIDEAIQMLEDAYSKKENDPYITDSVGWGYYLIGDYNKAEKYLKRAVELMPYDPIIHDHYGDVLWQLNRKIQAKYFWESVLELEDAEEKMKKNILFKLLNGPNKI
jgi:tetratricopeptide (TPR) repeat protein